MSTETTSQSAFQILLRFLGIQWWTFAIAYVVSIVLYFFDHHPDDTFFGALGEQASSVGMFVAILLLFVVYPLAWIVALFSFDGKTQRKQLVGYTLVGGILGIVAIYLFVGYSSFFNFRLGACPYFVGFWAGPWVYFFIRGKIKARLNR